jgi:hypothetical protein
VEIQLRVIAAGLGFVPRSVLKSSTSRDAISAVETTDFTMSLDIRLIHLKEFGNLKRWRRRYRRISSVKVPLNP